MNFVAWQRDRPLEIPQLVSKRVADYAVRGSKRRRIPQAQNPFVSCFLLLFNTEWQQLMKSYCKHFELIAITANAVTAHVSLGICYELVAITTHISDCDMFYTQFVAGCTARG